MAAFPEFSLWLLLRKHRRGMGSCLVVMVATLANQAALAYGSDRPDAADSWSVDVRLKNYFASNTSYEFGNPYPPYQAPLSRLEFPLNTQWIGLEARRKMPRFSAGIALSTNVSRKVSGTDKDFDWEDDANPGALSIYSQTGSRMEPSYIVRGDIDLKISDWLALPERFDLRPVAGFRWQRFSLVSHDGAQYYPLSATPPDALPGDVLQFEQTYQQYFLGMRTTYDLSGILPLQRLKLYTQLDWAYVEGNNQDRHLLRLGTRLTYDHTIGDAWHALLGLRYRLTENLEARLEADYLRIQTTGTHRLVNDAFNVDISTDYAVRVWSEQMNLGLGLEYTF